jgi:hypothetical protein
MAAICAAAAVRRCIVNRNSPATNITDSKAYSQASAHFPIYFASLALLKGNRWGDDRAESPLLLPAEPRLQLLLPG